MITPDRWQQVRTLFHRTLEQPAGDRALFLQRASEGDEEIRHEVESLLLAHDAAETFLADSPVGALRGGESMAPVRLAAGARLGSFEIVGPLGAGGMGEVYRARDTRLDRAVAIKVLSPGLAADPRSRERFEREARLISRLAHPHVCTLHDVGSALVDGQESQFLVMELLEGETLAQRLRQGPLPLDHAIRTALEILEALAAAHALGIVHRDLKPANIMLTKSGVKLLDFGLARPRSGALDPGAIGSADRDDSMTADGMVPGTVPYMAPEQVRGHEAEPRSDLFAFGAVLYEMLTGRRAFDAPSQPALVAAILEHDPPPPSSHQPVTPPALDRLVAACLSKDPNDRWQHAQDVALALRGIADGRSGESGVAPGWPRGAARAGSRRAGGRWRVHLAWAATAAAVAIAIWMVRPRAAPPAPPVNPRPVIVLMDSPLPGRIYDPRTEAAGGTNADDVSDALRDLPILTFKENTSPIWHREEQVREQNPDLVISHLSCLLDERVAQGQRPLADHLFDIAQNRLASFFGYLAATNPRTHFLVYSRGRIWPDNTTEVTWMRNVEARFPRITGRLHTMLVPGKSEATFRDPATAQLLRARVQEILELR